MAVRGRNPREFPLRLGLNHFTLFFYPLEKGKEKAPALTMCENGGSFI